MDQQRTIVSSARRARTAIEQYIESLAAAENSTVEQLESEGRLRVLTYPDEGYDDIYFDENLKLRWLWKVVSTNEEYANEHSTGNMSFVVRAHRYGNPILESYIVDTTNDFNYATVEADNHRDEQEGYFGVAVYSIEQQEPFPKLVYYAGSAKGETTPSYNNPVDDFI